MKPDGAFLALPSRSLPEARGFSMDRDPWPILFFGATTLPSSRRRCYSPLQSRPISRPAPSGSSPPRLHPSAGPGVQQGRQVKALFGTTCTNALELAPVQGLAATSSESTTVVALLAAEPVRPRARAMLHRRPPTTPRLSVRQPCCTLLS